MSTAIKAIETDAGPRETVGEHAPPAAHHLVTPVVQKWIEEGKQDPEAFWGRAANELPWFRKWDKVLKPWQLVRCTAPKSFRVLLALFDPLLHYRGDQMVRRRRCVLSNCFPGPSIRFNRFNCGTHNNEDSFNL